MTQLADKITIYCPSRGLVLMHRWRTRGLLCEVYAPVATEEHGTIVPIACNGRKAHLGGLGDRLVERACTWVAEVAAKAAEKGGAR